MMEHTNRTHKFGLIAALVSVFILLTVLYPVRVRGFMGGLLPVRGSGEIVRQGRDLPAFSKIRLRGPGVVHLKTGLEQSVVVETDDNLVDRYKTVVTGDELCLGFRSNINVDPSVMNIYIDARRMEGLTVIGSGDIYGRNPIHVEDFDIDIRGSGQVCLEVKAEAVQARVTGSGRIVLEADARETTSSISGSGKIEVSGLTGTHNLRIKGSGTCHGPEFQTDAAQIRIDGSGDCRIEVVESLEITIKGSGKVRYTGNPHVISTIRGTGAVRRDAARF